MEVKVKVHRKLMQKKRRKPVIITDNEAELDCMVLSQLMLMLMLMLMSMNEIIEKLATRDGRRRMTTRFGQQVWKRKQLMDLRKKTTPEVAENKKEVVQNF